MGIAERRIKKLLADSGVGIGDSDPWDILVHNPAFYRRVALAGSLGLGESYTEGWWDCACLDEMINRLFRSEVVEHAFVPRIITLLQAGLRNLQTPSRAFQVGQEHYDLGNDIYQAMLDKQMVYTCAYWAEADNLDRAQQDKLDLVARKLSLQPGMRVLDIGCGWGSFARHAADRFGVEVVGITISKEQLELGRERCRGLPVELRLQDYRDVNEQFDAIVSLGMFEHVGHKNYRTYMQMVARCLRDGGYCLLQTIGNNLSRIGTDPWITRYIFPNGEIPSLRQITAALEGQLIIEDVHSFGPDYDKTLIAWRHNFIQAWPELRGRYSERFYRLWTYYLSVCAGTFRARNLQLWQILLARGAPAAAYRRPV